MKTKLQKFVKKNRNYCGYELSRNIVMKSFNHGMGAIDLFRFYEDRKVVVYNANYYNKSDERKLSTFLSDNGMTDWKVVSRTLGYPEWYFHHLHI